MKRSPRWTAVARFHLEREPVCQVCGGKVLLNAHHKKPFHLFPSLELDQNNLITLCNFRRCHITFGHGGDFRAYNPDCETDIERARRMFQARKYAA